MRRFLNIALFVTAIMSLSGCSTPFKERKAPCPPTASLDKNPCNPMPINIGFILKEKEIIKS